MKNSKIDYDRGKIEKVRLAKPLNFNGNFITEAVIEIDHINWFKQSDSKIECKKEI